MDVAKRLDFDPTDTLTNLMDASQQRFQTANMAALQELQQAVQDLSVVTKQKQAQIMALAKQTVEQGVGDNDLKRLQRQFDSSKSTFINIDQKQRFMKGLWDIDIDIEHLTAIKDEQEQQLEQGSEALRRTKAQNEQARQKVSSTCGSINQVYSFVEQATDSTAAQLESTKLALQQHAARQPAPAAEAHLEPGPGQDEAQQLVEAETAQAKELERRIAAAEAVLSELEAQATANRQQLVALTAEVSHMEALAASRAKAADADKHTKDAAAWCEEVLLLAGNTTGLSVTEVTPNQLVLGITVRVPTSRQSNTDKPAREVQHQLTLQLQPKGNASSSGSSSSSSSSNLAPLVVSSAKLSPSCVDVSDLLEAAAAGGGGGGGAGGLGSGMSCVAHLVCEVRGRLLSYWRRRALVEAAAEVFPPGNASRGPPHIKASLPNQAEVEVLVPMSWPSDADEPLRVVQLAAPGLGDEAIDQLMAAVNADSTLLCSCDVLMLLQHVSDAVEQRLLDAAA